MKAKQINDGLITYQAIDKENIPRVYGYGETFVEAKNQCVLALDEYLLKKRKSIPNPAINRLYIKDNYEIVLIDKQVIDEFNHVKTILLDYQDKTGVDVSRTIDRLANDTQIKILKGVIKK
ncbi:MAG: hypothetical protein CBD16_00090 [Betaproteobacteria bacterium TMED156]|nr:MAG: hypothetical protein CBD16_00090 [Betaproteobacteria bacterium TMED156]|tara:strand:- start:2539 stop:2901 length:363 start_codon:yes stop_codon:yes gene_type:complete